MALRQFPHTEKEISKAIGRKIKSPIVVSNLEKLGMDKDAFLSFFAPFAEELAWDLYDVRRMQVEYLIQCFPKDKALLLSRLPAYFTGEKDKRSLRKWISQLSRKRRLAFKAIKPWRRRSVSKFILSETQKGIKIRRVEVPQFKQSVDARDIRALPRIFSEAPASHVENDFFYQLMQSVFLIVKKVRSKVGKKVKKISMTAHFMSVKASTAHPGDNSPEGAHEDGADYIISALVIKRQNLKGGQTQIIEQLENGKKEIIFRHTLQPGEFVFQADTRDELTYGTDLWHHVTPFHIVDPEKAEAWRDIIGFDINVLA